MYEYIIHLPKQDNDGNDVAKHVNACIIELIAHFGGATAHDARGMWIHDGVLYDEEVTRVVCAGPKTVENYKALKTRAQKFAAKTGQLAMYISTPINDVEIIETTYKLEVGSWKETITTGSAA